MKTGLKWYKREPVAFLGGVQGITSRQMAVYTVALDLIYEHGGSINNNPKWIAGWFSDLGASAVRFAISELVAMGKLVAEGDKLTQKRAETEVKAQQNRSETASKSGEKGGISSGVSRRAAIKNNDLSEATALSRVEESRIEKKEEQQPRENVPVIPFDATDRERLLVAMGADPISGQFGPNGKFLGSVADTEIAKSWMSMGISIERQCAVIAERCAAMRRNNPHWVPGRFAYFTGAMQDLIAVKTNPANSAAPDDMGKKMERWKRMARQ